MKKLLLSAILFWAIVGCDVDEKDQGDESGTRSDFFVNASRVHPTTSSGDSIPLEKVPMFIVLGFDDNGLPAPETNDGSTWIRNYLKDKVNPDGSPVRASFYMTGKYACGKFTKPDGSKENGWWLNDEVIQSWKDLEADGHEIGNHSMWHTMQTGGDYATFESRKYTKEDWDTLEFTPAEAALYDTVGFTANSLKGWRTPRLEWNDAIIELLIEKGYKYDCSIEPPLDSDGTNEYWPFVVDQSLLGTAGTVDFWELPVYTFQLPEEIATRADGDYVSGLDYNVWANTTSGGKQLAAEDFYTILKHNLDLRMQGNRAPHLIGLHSDMYTEDYAKWNGITTAGSEKDRQKALEDFIEYAIATYPEVRFVSSMQLIEWLEDPTPLQ